MIRVLRLKEIPPDVIKNLAIRQHRMLRKLQVIPLFQLKVFLISSLEVRIL